MDATEKKDKLTRIFNFVVYIINYLYQDLSAIPKDFLTEIHLRYYKHNKNLEKKILGVWDFNQRLSRLGDFMMFLEYLLILNYKFNLSEQSSKLSNKIDLAIIDDNTHYNSKQPRYFKSNKFKSDIRSLSIINNQIDSIYYFKSNEEFNEFFKHNRNRYIRWPPTISGTIHSDCRIIEQFYNHNKFLPELTIPLEITNEVYQFFADKVYPSHPIILNVRQNIRSTKRNTVLDEILKFLKHFENNKKFKFIIICNKSEYPSEFKSLQNVIHSKDYFNSIEYDLALIKASDLSIFPNSGMAVFAWFADVPFIQHGPHGKDKCTVPRNGKNFTFLKEYQRQFYDRSMEAEWMVKEFNDLFNTLNKNNMLNSILNNKLNNPQIVGNFSDGFSKANF